MKESNKKKIVCFILIFLIILGVILFFIYGNKLLTLKNNDHVVEEKKLSIIDKKTFVGYDLIKSYNGFFYLYKDKRVYVINDRGVEIAKFDDIEDKSDILLDTYIGNKIFNVFKINDIYYLYKKNGELVTSSNDEIKIVISSDEPYFIINNTLYSMDKDEIYKDKDLVNIDNFIVINDYIFVNSEMQNIMINMIDNNKIALDKYYNYDNYIVAFFKDGKKVSLVNKINGEKADYASYEQKNYGLVLFNNQEDKVILINDSKLIQYDERIKYDNYQFDYSLCENGFKVFDKDNNIISDNCFDKFGIGTNNEIELYENIDNLDMLNVSYLIDNKIVKYSPVGDYYIEYKDEDDSSEIILYDKSFNVIENKCPFSFNYDGNYYICGDTINNYFMNSSLEKVGQEYENIISYDNGYYAVIKNNMYGLLHNDEVLIDNKYNTMISDNNVIVASDAYRIDFYILGEGEELDSSKLYEDFIEYNDVNIDSLVKKYGLDDDIKIINENEQLFKKFAYLVENNSKLGKYKRYVMKTFKTVALNKEYMNEDYFLLGLKRLNIKFVKDRLNPNLCGLYSDGTVGIDIYCDEEKVVYHELTHFIDFRLGNRKSGNIYEYDGKYIDEYEYKNLDAFSKKKAVYKGTSIANFLTEGGAEINQAIYLSDNLVTTYFDQVKIYSMLSYILGTDKMNEIYFSSNGDYKLFSELVNSGWDYDKYKRFIELVAPNNYLNSFYRPYSEKERFEVADMMIDLYESKRNETKWYDDKVLFYLISNYIGYARPSTSYTNRSSEYMKIDTAKNSIIFDKVYANLKIGNVSRSYPIPSYYANGKIYMIVNADSKNYVVDYNVDINDVVNYRQIENKEVK